MRFIVLPLDWVFEYFEYYIVSSLLTLKLYVLFCLLLSLEITICTIKIMVSSITILMNSVMNFYQYNSLYTLKPYGPYISLLYFLTPNTCYFALNNINILKKHVCTCVNNSYCLCVYIYICFGSSLFIPTGLGFALGISSLQSKQLILLFHVLLLHWWWQIHLASLYENVFISLWFLDDILLGIELCWEFSVSAFLGCLCLLASVVSDEKLVFILLLSTWI